MLHALDLYSGAGGVCVGLQRAGFEVTGVDIIKQPRYPGHFLQADILSLAPSFFLGWDLIWASPPCQGYTGMNNAKDKHPKLIAPTREILKKTRTPWVIENVTGARKHLNNPIVLCGSHFGLGAAGWQLRRHRLFESSFPIEQPECKHNGPVIGVYGAHVRCRSSKYWRDSGADFPEHNKKKLAMECMGIDFMTFEEISEAIPPAYAEFIGNEAKRYIQRSRT